jgi:protein-S-isoprenylcysteine O-methyltransferase Ste14
MSSGVKINLLTLAILAIVLAGVAPHLRRVNWTPARMAGAAIAAISFAAIVVARFQLGAAFSVKAKARKLVTTGIYAKIRNPIYVFGELFIIGVALLSGRWMFLLVGAVMVPLQVWRARNEARVLREAFGEEYDRYRAQTWF